MPYGGGADRAAETCRQALPSGNRSFRFEPEGENTVADRSPARAVVGLQKGLTRLHVAFLESPLGSLWAPPGLRFLVLHTTGRRSGEDRATPLSFTRDGDAYILIASNGGAPRHPDWYLNLQQRPETEIVVRGQRKRVHAETVTSADRD